jgi:hypothetical protein
MAATTPDVRVTRRTDHPRVIHVEGLAPAEYRFVNKGRVPGTIEEVADIIQHPSEFRRGWPAAWLDYRLLEKGDPKTGVGRRFSYRVKGWLPYSLNLTFTITERDPPHLFVVRAEGDLVGEGRWTLVQDGDRVDVTYDWRVRAARPLIRRLSPFVKPIFRSTTSGSCATARTRCSTRCSVAARQPMRSGPGSRRRRVRCRRRASRGRRSRRRSRRRTTSPDRQAPTSAIRCSGSGNRTTRTCVARVDHFSPSAVGISNPVR